MAAEGSQQKRAFWTFSTRAMRCITVRRPPPFAPRARALLPLPLLLFACASAAGVRARESERERERGGVPPLLPRVVVSHLLTRGRPAPPSCRVWRSLLLARAVDSMLKHGEPRFPLNLDALRLFDPELTRTVLRKPAEYLPPFEEALREVLTSQDPAFAKQVPLSLVRIGVQGSFGAHHVSPRGLNASLLNSLVCVEGIVTKCTTVRPKVLKSTHYCPATAKFTSKEYRDLTSLGGGGATGSAYPTKDADGHLLETEYGLCEYIDHQMVTIQEMPERAPPGQLPRSIDCILEGDLCDRCKPGDRVQVSGIHRALPSKANSSGMFRTLLLANALRGLTAELAHDAFTREDLENIRTLSRSKDVLRQLAMSLAPSICGHDHEKVALLLMLLGGSEKNLANGTHLRGDLNILMLGDPSTAKSQLLRFVLRIARSPSRPPAAARRASASPRPSPRTTTRATAGSRRARWCSPTAACAASTSLTR